jgi:hypothetical protein
MVDGLMANGRIRSISLQPLAISHQPSAISHL